MAVTASSRVVEEDEKDPDFVPVSSWARQGLARHVTPASFDPDPIQYGPLTAQDNYLSHHGNVDWPSTSAPANGVSDASLDPYSNPVSSLASGAFGVMPASAGAHSSAVGSAWNNAVASDLIDNSHFELMGTTALPEPNYQHANHEAQLYGHPVPGEQYLEPTSANNQLSRMALGPWDGIWAWNPNNLEDNFVYPTNNLPTSAPLDPSPQQVLNEGSSSQPPLSLPTSLRQLDQPDRKHLQQPTTALQTNIAAMQPTPPASQNTPSPQSTSSHKSRQGSGARGIVATSSANFASAMSAPAPAPAPVPTTKTLRPEKVKRNKASQALTTVPRRQGPLSSEQRQKADDMRYYGACWRCRRYKKPCNGPGECDTCRTSGFRVWPSTVGCYRGDMEDFIIGVMPGNAETIMRDLSPSHQKVPNWKHLFGFQPHSPSLPILNGDEDRFAKLSVKLQATRMAGDGFIDLLDILANFQRSRSKPEAVLEHTCEALSYICDVYHAFVVTETTVSISPQDLMKALTEFRGHYSAIWRSFLALCLSGRRGAWFPAFLSSCVNVPLLVVLKDAFTAIPEPVRSTLWPNISRLIEDLRTRLYPMGLDLLSALAKGTKPWKLQCWRYLPTLDPETKEPIPGMFERDPDGLRLLGGDEGAFDGFASIQTWLETYRDSMIEGMSFLTTPPFSARNAKMQPIAALAWIFEVTPPGKRIVNGHLVDEPPLLPHT